MLGYFFSKFNEAAQGPSANLSGKKVKKIKDFFVHFAPVCSGGACRASKTEKRK